MPPCRWRRRPWWNDRVERYPVVTTKRPPNPVGLPEQTHLYNGRIVRPRLCRRALSKGEIEALARGFTGCAAALRNDVVGAWDFRANITSTLIVDTCPNLLNGYAINLPARGMTGFNWSADEIVYHHRPAEYGAIHFHDDDIDDARWDVDFEFTVPADLKSGIYAARLRIGGEDSPDTEDFGPFVVRPPRGQATARLAQAPIRLRGCSPIDRHIAVGGKGWGTHGRANKRSALFQELGCGAQCRQRQ